MRRWPHWTPIGYRLAARARRFLGRSEAAGEPPLCGRCGYDLTGNTSDRCPECGADDIQYIVWHLEQRERRGRIKATAMIVFGIPLSFLGPVVLASMFWLALAVGLSSSPAAYGATWFRLLLVLTVIAIPLLYRLELRHRGHYLNDVLRETNVYSVPGLVGAPGVARELAAVASVVANPRAVSSLFVEVFLAGPRMTIDGFCQRRLARAVQHVELRRAALVVNLLLHRDGGIDTMSLLVGNESKADLLSHLAYLCFHQWIGVGTNWDRVWLDSESRHRIMQR